MNNDAEDWLLRYAEVLQWSQSDIMQAVSKYFAATDQTEKLRSFLQYETGVTLELEDDDHAYRGHPFVVFAYGHAEHYELEEFERADVGAELEALQAFTRFVNDERFADVVLSRFDERGELSLEIMRYCANTDPAITTQKCGDYDYPEAFMSRRKP